MTVLDCLGKLHSVSHWCLRHGPCNVISPPPPPPLPRLYHRTRALSFTSYGFLCMSWLSDFSIFYPIVGTRVLLWELGLQICHISLNVLHVFCVLTL